MAYQRLNPKIIALDELPPEGRSFTYTQESGELDPDVKDLVKDNPYHLDFSIKPLGNAFEMKGHFSTTLNLLCSRCAIDFKFPVQESINEIIMVEESRPRTARETRVNHTSDLLQTGPFANLIANNKFDVGEFFHEIIALAEPMQPLGKAECDETCENFQKAIAEGWLKPTQQRDEEFEQATSPFAVLKQLKS